jgi:hypothetical protein
VQLLPHLADTAAAAAAAALAELVHYHLAVTAGLLLLVLWMPLLYYLHCSSLLQAAEYLQQLQ